VHAHRGDVLMLSNRLHAGSAAGPLTEAASVAVPLRGPGTAVLSDGNVGSRVRVAG
jgi:hypothetical protein